MDRAGENRPRVAELDGLRGVAISMVLACHFATLLRPRATWLESGLHPFACHMGVGVDLFFVLSGFLITGILIESKGSPHYFGRFYLNRALRILPLYYFFTFAISLYDPASVSLPYLFFLGNWRGDWGVQPHWFSHLWSLCIEEQFYLVWPLVVALTSPRQLGVVCAAGIVSAMAVRGWLVGMYAEWEAIHRFTPVKMDCLLIGGFIAQGFRHPAVRATIVRWAPLVALITLAIWGAQLSPILVGEPARALLFASLVALAASRSPRVAFLKNRALVYLGRVSYGLYIWHMLTLEFNVVPISRDTLVGRLAVALGCFAVSLVMAELSWHALEQPFLRLKRYCLMISTQRGMSPPASVKISPTVR